MTTPLDLAKQLLRGWLTIENGNREDILPVYEGTLALLEIDPNADLDQALQAQAIDLIALDQIEPDDASPLERQLAEAKALATALAYYDSLTMSDRQSAGESARRWLETGRL